MTSKLALKFSGSLSKQQIVDIMMRTRLDAQMYFRLYCLLLADIYKLSQLIWYTRSLSGALTTYIMFDFI